ncbi:bZIP transcription factor 60-like [Quillaja saponaria]|uniref:BZIP transcription factor 60-like n=1 Tax=Quillaja saponaria TaxID=32244 RepID=A0AAD7M0V8_QUISA|nr:bZIP transcription factor 60-like [Quillaja saponaria]
MDGLEFLQDDIIDQIDWDNLLDGFPSVTDLFQEEHPVVADGSSDGPIAKASPNSVCSGSPLTIGDIENLLMEDDDHKVSSESSDSREYCETFLADLIVESPDNGHGDVADALIDNDSNASGDGIAYSIPDKGKVVEAGEDTDDPISKKQRRRMRNRDAAVRSRERKKVYVRDLEMKSRYLEGECRRLGRLLQCCYAENHALRLSLQSESLLLGSLLWLLGIMCLLILPIMPHSILQTFPLKIMERKGLERVAPRGAGSEMVENLMILSFVKSRRCKASRPKIKIEFSGYLGIDMRFCLLPRFCPLLDMNYEREGVLMIK